MTKLIEKYPISDPPAFVMVRPEDKAEFLKWCEKLGCTQEELFAATLKNWQTVNIPIVGTIDENGIHTGGQNE